MENHTGDHKFSFPATTTINPVEEQGASFEFGCKTPDSPKSPADHLFFNGKLQPHIFPCQQPQNLNLNNNLSRSTSRTSSNGSMDSLLSSRSNSTGSGSTRSSRSSCSSSSARTSISEAATSSGDSKRTITHRQNPKLHRKSGKSRKGDSLWDHYQTKKKPALTPHFSSSRRWQFITPAPGPTLRCQSSLRMTAGRSNGGEGSTSKKENMAGTGSWFDRRFFKWFVSACLSCYTTANINSLTDKEYNDVY